MQFIADHADNIAPILWHANFPYPIDPFYANNPADNQGRIGFYHLSSVPSEKVDGLGTSTSYSALTDAYNARLAVPTDVSLDVTGSWDAQTRQVEVQVTASTTSALPAAEYSLFIVLTESQVYYEATNGILWHEYTMRDAFPDYAGTLVTFSGEFPQEATASASFVLPTGAPPNEYRPEYCDIVCFLQETNVGAGASLREVHQAARVPLEQLGQTPVATLPAAPRLGQNYPNPFNPTTSIPVSLADEGSLRLSIVDVQGRRLRILHEGPMAAGDHTLRWDGRDEAGRPVGSGVYLAQLEYAGGRESRRLVLMK